MGLFPYESSVFLFRAAKQVAVADSRGRHWLPKREGAHEVGRTASGYLPLQHSYQPALIPISLH